MNCTKCGQEMTLSEEDPDGEIPCCAVEWDGQPDWVIAEVEGTFYECVDCDEEFLEDEDDREASRAALVARTSKLVQPPDGHAYMLLTRKAKGAWPVSVTTLLPCATRPVPEVMEAMVREGKDVARSLGWRKTPETRLLECLQRLLRLRALDAPEVILEHDRKLVLKYLCAFDPAFDPGEIE